MRGFVEDGRRRHARAVEERIRQEVYREHAHELRQARWWRRLLLHRRLKSEIRRRLRRELPHRALYLRG